MPRFRRLRRIAARTLPIATKDDVRSVQKEAARWRSAHEQWRTAYERLLAAVEGRSPGTPLRTVPQQDPAVKLAGSGIDLVRAIRSGESLTPAAMATVRDMLRTKKLSEARAFAQSLADDPTTAEIGFLLIGLIAGRQGHDELALSAFAKTSTDDILRLAPDEYFRSLFINDHVRFIDELDAIERTGIDFGVRTWFELVKQAFATRDMALTERVFTRFRAAHTARPDEWSEAEKQIAWLEAWIGRERHQTAPTADPARISFGLMDYVQPGRVATSDNIGDYIQTLASIGHLVRHEGLRFHGDTDVVDFVQRMQGRVRPELKLTGLDADAQLHVVARDASTYQQFPEDTWMLEFGWHMHGLFDYEVYDFPLHKNINPIFVSFHCRKRNMMTAEAIEYLRQHAPIGCRDWATVDLLLSLDIPAFFSGCLTTTVNTVFPELDTKPAPRTLYVDSHRTKPPAGVTNVKQCYPEVKQRNFARNMQDAVDLLEDYRRNYTEVFTVRLHCYLPTTSLGMKAHFEPANNADERFGGLFRLDATAFEKIRTSMRDRLEPIVEAIFRGTARDEVYRLWNEVNAEDLRIARERHDAGVAPQPQSTALIDRARRLMPTLENATGSINVVVPVTTEALTRIPTLLSSARDHSSRPLRAWLVGALDRGRADVAVDGVEIRIIDTSSLADSNIKERAWLDRVLLPELLPVERAIMLPVDGLVTADLSELADLPLGEAVIAARTTSRAVRSGFAALYAAAYRFDDDPHTAYEFHRRIHSRLTFDFDAFDLDVALLDLARMRDAGTALDGVDAMRRFRLTDREAYLWLFGDSRHELAPVWGYVPDRDSETTPKVWHWVDATKPWSVDVVAGRELWREADASG